MIEILIPGAQPKKVEQRFKITCPYCHCTFTCGGEDISSSRNPFEDTSMVSCPECHSPVKFSRKSAQVLTDVE